MKYKFCPFCGVLKEPEFAGRTKGGRKRYKCTECGKSFVDYYGEPLTRSDVSQLAGSLELEVVVYFASEGKRYTRLITKLPGLTHLALAISQEKLCELLGVDLPQLRRALAKEVISHLGEED